MNLYYLGLANHSQPCRGDEYNSNSVAIQELPSPIWISLLIE